MFSAFMGKAKLIYYFPCLFDGVEEIGVPGENNRPVASH